MLRTGIFLEKIHTSKFIIAYLDMLGSKKNMTSENSEKYLNDLNNILFDLREDIKALERFENTNFFIKIFSDNVLFGIEFPDEKEGQVKILEKMLNIAGATQNEALRYGYLLRGAITIGQFYKDNIFVYGEALSRAVVLEENVADVPRIIVNDDVYKIAPQYFFQLPEEDEVYTLNSYIFHVMPDFYYHVVNLLRMLHENKDNEKIKRKIMWSIKYYNFYLKSFKIDGIFANLIDDIQIKEALS